MTDVRHDIEVAALLRDASDEKAAADRRQAIQHASSAVKTSKAKTFETLARASGLDPTRHYRLADWRGLDFSNCNLRGFDFTGARLWGAKFDGALISAGPDRDGKQAPAAIFDQAEWSAVSCNREPGSSAPGVLLAPIADLSTAADYDAYVRDWKPGPVPIRRPHLRTGAIFQDAPFAPEMMVVPSGTYLQGDETKPVDGINRREVTIAHRLAVGRFPVTFEEWDACHADGGTKHKPDTRWERGRQPVHSVSWDDITNDYLPWLNKRLGLSGAHGYRLLTEAEWEYCCRAGTETAFSFGATISTDQANYDGRYTFGGGRKGEYRQKTTEVGSFPSNAWGLHDMHGNIWEWCHDSAHDTYRDAPDDGSAREDAPTGKDKTVSRVLRGGSWDIDPQFLRSAGRLRNLPDSRDDVVGFRLARTLHP
jgi:formylglycine-generating enzyme required for sulfatase activity